MKTTSAIMPDVGQITHLLQKADEGDSDAANQLFVLVEKELRGIAAKRRRLAGKADLCITMLVDDAFCRLVGQEVTIWNPGDRKKFFGYACKKIHSLVIDELRKRQAVKRAGECQGVDGELSELIDGRDAQWKNLSLLVDLQTALTEFERFASDDALAFRLRYFGATFDEVAKELGISKTAATRAVERARAWLMNYLKDYLVE